jgi:outer membrane protein TolC
VTAQAQQIVRVLPPGIFPPQISQYNYYTLRALDVQIQILMQTVEAYREQVRLVSVQPKNGLVGPIVLSQAQAQLESTVAQLSDTRRARGDEEHALAILCGSPAPSFAIEPTIPAPIFEGGRLKANPEAARAVYRESVAVYLNQVLVRALGGGWGESSVNAI